jgi:hypothetical protein
MAGLDVNEWVEISGSSLSNASVMTAPNGSNSPQGKQDAWCGWQVDTRTSKVYSRAQGGHDDYHGNEVNVIDLSAASPSWSQLIAPTAAGANITSADLYYGDGRPSSQHGYYGEHCIEGLNKLLGFPGGAISTGGGTSQEPVAFDLLSSTHDADGNWTGPGGSTFNTGAVTWVKHPVTEDVYGWQANTRILRWNRENPGTWTTLVTNPANPSILNTAAAVDYTRGVIYFLGGGSAAFSRRFNLVDNTIDTITLTGTDLSATATAAGMVYVAATDKYYVCPYNTGGGSSVHTITPTSGTSWACASLSTTGGGSIPEAAVDAQGARTKFLYLPKLGCLIWGPKWSANIWALRIV